MEEKCKNTDTMYVAIAANAKFIKYAYVMLTSLFENNKDRDICVYVLVSDLLVKELDIFEPLREKYEQQVIVLPVGEALFPENLVCTDYWPIEIWYRIALPELLPCDVKRILYLDVDVIVKGNLDELYDMSFEDHMFIGCHDYVMPDGISQKQAVLFQNELDNAEFKYFNSGVLLMNLECMRKEDAFHEILKMSAEKRDYLVAPDQDILNYMYWNRTKYVDRWKYNFYARLAFKEDKGYEWATENASIIHYAGHKPWDNKALHFETERFWWEYASKTLHYTELLEKFVLEIVESNFWYFHVNELYDARAGLLQDNNELRQLVVRCQEVLQKLS